MPPREACESRPLLDTHLQADHLSGGVALSKAAGADYWLHPYDSIHPDDLLPATFPFRYLQGDMSFTLGEVRVRMLHLPGHTLGMTNPLVDGRYLVTGDTLLSARSAAPTWVAVQKTWAPLLYHSLQRVLALPENTIVLPAHLVTCTRRMSRAATAPPSVPCAAATRACSC